MIEAPTAWSGVQGEDLPVVKPLATAPPNKNDPALPHMSRTISSLRHISSESGPVNPQAKDPKP